MTWTAPITFVAGSALTAAQLNAFIRDNQAEMATAKASTPGGYFISTGIGAIAERLCDSSAVLTSQTTTSTSFVNLTTTGPTVTVTTGTQALVHISARMSGSVDEMRCFMSFAVSGATTIAAVTDYSATHKECFDGSATPSRIGALSWVALTAGSNTFTAKYSQAAGGTATFSNRRMFVIAL